MAEKGKTWEYDFYIISADNDWEEKVLKELHQSRPDVKCLSQKDAVPGRSKTQNLIKPISLCKKVVVGFSSQPPNSTSEYVSTTVFQKMLDEKSIDQEKLIPVKITEDAVVPNDLVTLTVGNFLDQDFYKKLLSTLLEQEVSTENKPKTLHRGTTKESEKILDLSDNSDLKQDEQMDSSTQVKETQLESDLKQDEQIDVNEKAFTPEKQTQSKDSDLKLDAQTDVFKDVISQLNLQKFYPRKITFQEALLFSSTIMSLDTELTNENIPWVMLQYLLMCNYNGRCLVSSEKSATFDFSDCMGHSSYMVTDISEPDQVSPADTLVALFLCSDNFLRQLLVEKLSMCQLAIQYCS